MKPTRRWLFVAVGLLAANALAMATLVVASSWSRPTVVPNYYERAVRWDQRVAAAEPARQYGWQVDLAVGDGGATVHARDGRGLPLRDLHLRGVGRHRSAPEQRIAFELVTDEQGLGHTPRAAAQAWSGRPGWYEIDLEIQSGALHYFERRSIELVRGFTRAGRAGRAEQADAPARGQR
jgi:nitrogen fixation protein FixH